MIFKFFDIVDLLFLPMIFFIGLVTSWQDYREGIIRNKWLKIGIYYALAAYSLLLVWHFWGMAISDFIYSSTDFVENYQSRVYVTVEGSIFIKVAMNSLASLVFGFFLWQGRFFSAGDAKLFFVYSLLIPTKYYWKSYLPIFPSFVLLLNIFILVFVYLVLKSSFILIKNFNWAEAKTKLLTLYKTSNGQTKARFISLAIKRSHTVSFFMALVLLFTLCQDWVDEKFGFNIFNLMYILILFMLLVRINYENIFKNRLFLNYLYWSLVILLIANAYLYGFFNIGMIIGRTIAYTLVVVVGMIAFEALFRYFFENYSLAKYNVGEIRPGMNFPLETVEGWRSLGLDISPIDKRGLSREQAEKIRTWASKNNLREAVAFAPFPFAAWIFLGVLVTMLIKQTILHLFLF